MMNEEFLRMVEMSQQGFYCSQVLMMLALNKQGKENPDLIRAMGGLAGGIGFLGKNCGSLTGAACVLALYGGKGKPEEREDEEPRIMIAELHEWFQENIGKPYDSIDCLGILEGTFDNKPKRCPQIVYQTNEKLKEILTAHGYELEGKMEE